MLENKNLRTILGLCILLVVVFYSKGENTTKSKIEKPDERTLELVKNLSDIDDKQDSAKLSGVFYAISKQLYKTNVNSNLQVQYFLDYVGKNTLKDELMSGGGKKYPNFAPSASSLIEKVIGPQTSSQAITDSKKQELQKLFKGFAWKLYNKDNDSLFESYKSSAEKNIAKYNNEDDNPKPDDDEDECLCEGKGYIIHGDGHKSTCPCLESGKECKHNPRCGSLQKPTEQKLDCECKCVTRDSNGKLKTVCGCIKKYGQCYCNSNNTTAKTIYNTKTASSLRSGTR